MSIFEKIERACAALIERSFAKTFPSDLEPAQIARKLVATMEAGTHGEEGKLLAPGWYTVDVNPEDFERLAPHQHYLEREWAQLLDDLAARVGITFLEGTAKVTMRPRESVPLGAVDLAAGATRRFSLRMIKGVSSFGVYSVEGAVRIGRADESDVLLADPSVSRAHAIVETTGPEPTVRDLGSTNGTFVNGERVEARTLRDGDELRFGNTRMQFEIDKGSSA
ncbi:MAG: DUF3662 domain-containing protein, partial [Candidatus Eremiobacteraeota bacterium]|nr:DUF3662 domain-containing protein [Candidatus Eremiobacteraeota bacterium]